MTTDLTRLHAHEMAAGLRAGRVLRARELVDAHLRRIERDGSSRCTPGSGVDRDGALRAGGRRRRPACARGAGTRLARCRRCSASRSRSRTWW